MKAVPKSQSLKGGRYALKGFVVFVRSNREVALKVGVERQ
jgi:hypothetical protein